MRLLQCSAIALLSLLGSSAARPHSSYGGTFSNVTIFDPPSDYNIPRTLYARTLVLNQNHEKSNVMLATWENYSPEPPLVYFPIYQSNDLGHTWFPLSNVTDQVNGWGLRYQPFLYELAEPVGQYPAGTILCAGNSIPTDLNYTKIDLYASKDRGHSWHFVSTVASGGRAIPNNGETPVWEPFMMVYKGEMIMYYSDQRDPEAGQKLVHQVSKDLKHWGPVVDDVKYSTYDWRPGMTTVSLLPNGKYMLTYEFYGAVEAAFAVYYRINENPLKFQESEGVPLISNDGTIPVGSPYNVWTPAGGKNGTIVVSCGSDSAVFINKKLGDKDSWVTVASLEGTSYTRSLCVMPDPKDIMLAGGGVLNGEDNEVTCSVMDITA